MMTDEGNELLVGPLPVSVHYVAVPLTDSQINKDFGSNVDVHKPCNPSKSVRWSIYKTIYFVLAIIITQCILALFTYGPAIHLSANRHNAHDAQ